MSVQTKTYILIRKRVSGFRLIQRQSSNNKTKTKTLENPRIDAINVLYCNGDIPEVTAIARLKAIREDLYRQMGKRIPLGNTDNSRVLDRFWRHYRRKHKKLKDKDSAFHKFRRAMDVLGPHNITTASEDDMQDSLDNKAKELGWSANNHQKIGGALRAILKFLGRTDVDLVLESSSKSEVVYLTEDEAIKLANSVSDENLKNIILSAYYSGLRVGELMYLKPSHISDSFVNVRKQLKRDGTISNTKTGIERKAFILKGGNKTIEKWASSKKKLPMRQENLSHYIRSQSKKILDKSIKFHDLRHSYAVYLVSKGAPLELVAQSMGNSVKVCEKYYSGYQLTSIGIETLKRIVK